MLEKVRLRVEHAADAVDTVNLDRLSFEDGRELTWYLCRPGTGLASSFGMQLERAMGKTGWVPCLTCGGKRAINKPGTGRRPMSNKSYREAIRDWRRKELERLGLLISEGPIAAALEELGRRTITKSQAEAAFAELPESMTRLCKRCGGTGMLHSWLHSKTVLTARPTGSSKSTGASAHVSMADPDLERFGRVSRRLRHVRLTTARGAVALEAYYAGGFMSAVHEYTVLGRRLLLEGNSARLAPQKFFANMEADAQRAGNEFSASMRLLMLQLDRQARVLVAEGARAWNKHGRLVEPKQPKKRTPSFP